MFPPPKPTGTISPNSLQDHHQPRVFRHAHSFPLTSSSSQSLGTCTTSSFGSNIAISHPSEYVPRHAPIPEDWMIQLPSSPTQAQSQTQAVNQDHRIQPEISLLIPDYNGMEEGDEKLLRAASAMLAENDAVLLAQPHLIDFTFPHSQSQSQSLYQQTRQPFRSWSSASRRVISPFRIHPYAHAHAHAHAGRVKGHETSSPDSSDSFDTPLSVRQKRRREQFNSRKGLFGVDTNSMGRDGAVKESIGGAGEETFYGIRRGNNNDDDDETPNTPTPIRFHNPTIRSTSKFSSLDNDEDEDEEEEEEEIEEVGGTRKGRERDLWSAELIDMDMDIDINVGSKEVDDVSMGMGMGVERERSLGTVMIDSTPMKENESSPVSSGKSEFELDIKEEESDEYPSSPFQPTPLRSHQPVPQSPTPTHPTPLLAHSQEEEEEEEEGFINDPFGERELGQGRGVEGEGGGGGGGRYWKDGKGWRMVAEFRKYLDGERSGRDPRFDLKVFHWILTGCPEMQWSANGYGIEIKDVPAFYKNVLHKEAREKKELMGKVATKRDLPGKTSFERQLSGYGFRRVTTGKFMTIERPDLRRDNHDLLRRVQEVSQIIEEGSLMPKVKLERTSTTSNLRTKVRSLEQEVQQKDSKLEQMKKLITVLATDQVSPRKLHKMVSELGIDLPELTDPKSNSDINTTMDMDFELDKILTPLNTHKTRSNTLKSRTEVKLKAEPKVKGKAKGHGKGKGEGKGKITANAKPKLQVKSINTPIPTPTSSKSRPKFQGIINEEATPLKSIEDDIVVPKLNKKGRGKKMA